MSTGATLTPALGFLVLHRAPAARARWKPVAIVKDQFAALAASTGRGDWTTRPLLTAEQVADAEADLKRRRATAAPK